MPMISALRKETDEFLPSWQLERRTEYLKGVMTDAILDYWEESALLKRYILEGKIVEMVITQQIRDRLIRSILRAQGEIIVLRDEAAGKAPEITETMIAAAKSYPAAALHEFNSRGWGLCPFHGDRHASLHIHENRLKCWSGVCAFEGDTIDFIMKKEGLSFVQAVKRLQ